MAVIFPLSARVGGQGVGCISPTYFVAFVSLQMFRPQSRRQKDSGAKCGYVASTALVETWLDVREVTVYMCIYSKGSAPGAADPFL